ncbi:hypothetical protein [Streptomyces roseifaciens]|uniref:hypothetical protein n=1 Tax=Streptomyces roseifaciens TaxID=1488406 RepID=UPI0007181BB2|nr:hypothetical protein [Streptomyces roseifaciens]
MSVRTGPPESVPAGRPRAEPGRTGLRQPAPGARDAETVVRISIERLEVRAASPASPAARPQEDAGHARKAGPGLDEYLRGRT